MGKRRSGFVGNSNGNGNDNDNDNDHDNDHYEKESKIQRTDQKAVRLLAQFLFVVFLVTLLTLNLDIVHQELQEDNSMVAESVEVAAAVAARSSSSSSSSLRQLVKASVDSSVIDDTKGSRNSNNNNNNNSNKKKADPHHETTTQDSIDTELTSTVDALEAQVRARKKTPGVIMETDEEGVQLTQALQQATTELLQHRYGANITQRTQFRVVVDLIYPKIMIHDPDSDSTVGQLTIELAPIALLPCSVFYFLELVRTYQGGEIHRNAGHVLQISAQSGATSHPRKAMPFQEYSPDFPHVQYTTGYAGRPSGPEWYISIKNNKHNHGPGSQQKANPYEADSNFGAILPEDIGILDKIHAIPKTGFLPGEYCVKIPRMTLLVKTAQVDDRPETWTEWKANM